MDAKYSRIWRINRFIFDQEGATLKEESKVGNKKDSSSTIKYRDISKIERKVDEVLSNIKARIRVEGNGNQKRFSTKI